METEIRTAKLWKRPNLPKKGDPSKLAHWTSQFSARTMNKEYGINFIAYRTKNSERVKKEVPGKLN